MDLSIMFAHRMFIRVRNWSLYIIFAMSMVISQVVQQRRIEAQEPEADNKASGYYPAFLRQADELEIQLESDSKALVRVDDPLMRFTIGDKISGSVFLWLNAKQRPAMIGTIGSIEINRVDIGFSELHVMSDDRMKPISIVGVRPKRWTPEPMKPTTPIQDSPSVADSVASRLTQMRSIARNYSATMIGEDGRPSDLRLLPQPLYRYADSNVERDGAIFAYVLTVGTDPEFLLWIESRMVEGKPVWCMQPLRFTWRALQLNHNGEQVWEVKELLNRDDRVQTTPYVTSLTQPMK